MASQTLKVTKRKVVGRKVKALRRDGLLPANIYGKKIKSEAIQTSLADFEKTFKEVGETGIVELILAGKKRPVLIHNIQRDPVSDSVIHVDFLQVNLKEKVTAQVAIELVGEAPAEKEGGGTTVQHLDEIEVEALPKDLPEKFKLDLTQLKEINAVIKVGDLKVDDSKIKINNDKDQIIVKVDPPRKVEEEVKPEEETDVEVEGEENGEEKKEEGVEKGEEEKKEEVQESEKS